MSAEKLSPGAAARAQRDADFAARFGGQPKAVAPKADPAAPARSRAVAIRAGLTSWAETRRLIMDARQAEDWIVLGYTSFELYCEGEFSMKSLRLTAEERQDAILAFRSAGMTVREIGAATGTSKNTAQRALKAAEVDLRVPDGTKLPQVEALRQAIEDAAVSKDSFACEDCGKKLAAGIVRAAQTRCLKCDPERIHFAREVGGPCEACEADEAETHAASTERTEDASPALGETGPEPAPNGLGSAGPEPDRAGLGSGPQDSPAAESASSPHAGVPAVGDQIEERDEEEAVEASVDTPARAAGAKENAPGDVETSPASPGAIVSPAADPMAPPSPQQPGQDSPTGLEAVQPHEDRSETSSGWGSADVGHEWATTGETDVDFATDHHAPASGAGEAPEVASTDPVEPGELEDGEAAVTPSSSDLDVAGNPAERLLLAVAGLVHYLDQVDVDVVGPLLLGPDVEQLFDHADAITAHVERIGRARFAEMLHTQ